MEITLYDGEALEVKSTGKKARIDFFGITTPRTVYIEKSLYMWPEYYFDGHARAFAMYDGEWYEIEYENGKFTAFAD